jgi:hypothetical protein
MNYSSNSLRDVLDLFPEDFYYIGAKTMMANLTGNPKFIQEVRIIPFSKSMIIQYGFALNTVNEDIEGPFISIPHLEHCSIIYNMIKLRNPQKASQLFISKIRRVKSITFEKYFTIEFQKLLPSIIEHTFLGKTLKKGYSGLHFYNTDLIELTKRSKIGDKGLWNTSVGLKLSQTDKVITKYTRNDSTYWPYDWTIEKVIIEISIAWKNKYKEKDSNYRYRGKTSNDISVLFVIVNNTLKSVYPVMEKS